MADADRVGPRRRRERASRRRACRVARERRVLQVVVRVEVEFELEVLPLRVVAGAVEPGLVGADLASKDPGVLAQYLLHVAELLRARHDGVAAKVDGEGGGGGGVGVGNGSEQG